MPSTITTHWYHTQPKSSHLAIVHLKHTIKHTKPGCLYRFKLPKLCRTQQLVGAVIIDPPCSVIGWHSCLSPISSVKCASLYWQQKNLSCVWLVKLPSKIVLYCKVNKYTPSFLPRTQNSTDLTQCSSSFQKKVAMWVFFYAFFPHIAHLLLII